MEGIHAALESGIPVKLNCVPQAGVNEGELEQLAALAREKPVQVRFIEMMPMCDGAEFGTDAYIPFTRVLQALPQLCPAPSDGGVAKLFRLPDAKGCVGLISPVSAHFCQACNRLRLTADGRVKPCLHSGAEYPLKGLDLEAMRAQLETAICAKPRWHGELDAAHRSGAGRSMNQIGG